LCMLLKSSEAAIRTRRRRSLYWECFWIGFEYV
jgi:hypothetical protein